MSIIVDGFLFKNIFNIVSYDENGLVFMSRLHSPSIFLLILT